MYILYTHFLYYICCKIDYYSKDKKGTISQVTNNLLMTYVISADDFPSLFPLPSLSPLLFVLSIAAS